MGFAGFKHNSLTEERLMPETASVTQSEVKNLETEMAALKGNIHSDLADGKRFISERGMMVSCRERGQR